MQFITIIYLGNNNNNSSSGNKNKMVIGLA